MLKQKFCLWWIWYLLFDNAHFQRWLAWHRRRGWELAHVGGLFFHFTRGDGTDYRYYVQVMKDFPWTEQGRAYIAGVEELGVTYLGCFLHRAYFRWVDDGRPEEMFSDLVSPGAGGKVRAQRADFCGGAVRARRGDAILYCVGVSVRGANL